MNLTSKIAFGCYLLVALVVAGIGIRYLLASQIMPYHAAAMDSTWENLAPGVQSMSLNFMKSAGIGFLSTAIAVFMLLLFPFRKDELWARWALVTVSLTELILITFRVVDVRMNTAAEPPLVPFIVLIGLAVMGFLLSLRNNDNMQPSKIRI